MRAGRARIADFLDLVLAFGDETDHAVLDELVGRLAYVEARLVDGEDQERFRRLVERLFLPRLQQMGWDPVAGETDQDRLRRAALLRAVAGVARAKSVLAETGAPRGPGAERAAHRARPEPRGHGGGGHRARR